MSESVPGTYREVVSGTRIVLPLSMLRQHRSFTWPRKGQVTRSETSSNGSYAFFKFVLGLAQFLERSSEVLELIVELFFDCSEVVDGKCRQVDCVIGESWISLAYCLWGERKSEFVGR